jgi:mevalonate kinase
MELFKYSDNNDRLRMLKYALIFTGIVRPNSENAQQVMDDLRRFMHPEMTDVIDQQSPQPQGFRLDLINNGPSRSGFASSSAVAVCLLQVLYMCSGQYDLGTDRIRLGSMALLFENRLGLKSGRQDVDGLLPNGLKILRYPPTTGFVCPEIETWSSEQFDFSALPSHFVLVDTGIPRPGFLDLRRGLNMRHWAFLSRDPLKYPAIRKSLGIHVQIVDAFRLQNWPRLGVLLTDYMQVC